MSTIMYDSVTLRYFMSIKHCSFSRISLLSKLNVPSFVYVLCTVPFLWINPISISSTFADETAEQAKISETQPEEIEELMVQGQRLDLVEMEEDTERLFSIAGAADDPLQAIYALPGVTFSADGEPVVRGSAPQDNAYYIDLVPSKYLFHIFGNSIFNKNLIRSFDLYPAAFPSQFGNATGGVIDVSLRDPRSQEMTTTLNWSFLITGVMVESAINENQSFYASYRRSLLDQFISEDDAEDGKPPEHEGVFLDDFPVAEDYQFKYNWYINDQTSLTFVAAGASDELGITFTENSEAASRDPDIVGPLGYDQGFDSQGIIWEWQSEESDKNLRASLSHTGEFLDLIYGNNQKQLIKNSRSIVRLDYSQPLPTLEWEDHIITAGIIQERRSYDYFINAKIPNCSDFDPECSTIDLEFTTITDKLDVNLSSLYLQDQFRFLDKHSFVFGAHYFTDDYLNETSLEPRFNWQFEFAENWLTHAAVGRYSQLPELDQILQGIGNPNLKTIKSDHYAWGIKNTLDHGWHWTAELYYKSLKDLVISITDPAHPNFEEGYTNDAKGKAYGLELLLNKNITEKWYGWLALSLGKTERTDMINNRTVPFDYDKPVILNLVANYLLSDRWTLGAKWSYQTGGFYTPIIDLEVNANNPDINDPVYGEYNSERYPDYHRLDLRAEYTSPKSWGHWKLFVDFINAYSQKNIEGYEYAPRGLEAESRQPPGFGDNVPVRAEEGIGFFPSIGFEAQF